MWLTSLLQTLARRLPGIGDTSEKQRGRPRVARRGVTVPSLDRPLGTVHQMPAIATPSRRRSSEPPAAITKLWTPGSRSAKGRTI